MAARPRLPTTSNPGTENGHSFNPLVKIDYNINAKNTLSLKGYFGDGNQTAPASSELSPYFEVAPIHVENYSVIYNHIFSAKLTNQAFFGVSYFDQVFSDAQHNYNPVALGLNTGVTDPGLAGAPKITIGPTSSGSGLTGNASGFDPIGVTPPEGRQDITAITTMRSRSASGNMSSASEENSARPRCTTFIRPMRAAS